MVAQTSVDLSDQDIVNLVRSEVAEEVDEKELRNIQSTLNEACSLFIKIFKIGEASDHKKSNVVQMRRLPSMKSTKWLPFPLTMKCSASSTPKG